MVWKKYVKLLEGKVVEMKVVKDILRGILIGIANAIPGVSGGTMMVSMGIYDKIIHSVTHLFKEFKKSVLTLLPYGVGMVIGIVGLAFAIEAMYAHIPFQTNLLFIGLILGCLPILTGKMKGQKIGVSHAVVFLIFFVGVIILKYVGDSTEEVSVALNTDLISLVKLFFIGVIASAAMVIPGVSGSMMLMILGYYTPIISSITDFISALVAGDFEKILHICCILVPFGIGVVIGIFAIAKLIEVLLSRFETLTYAGILGLVVSSPVVILMGTALGGLNVVTILTGVLALAVGTGVALCLGK